MRSDSHLHEPRTDAEQSETGGDLRVIYESRPCDLYFVRMEIADRPIKIGRSTATGRRLRMLQCASPYPLTCLGLVYGEGEWEPRWHEIFAGQRLSGEWFAASPELERAIETAARAGSRVALGLPADPDWRAELGLVQ